LENISFDSILFFAALFGCETFLELKSLYNGMINLPWIEIDKVVYENWFQENFFRA
jgi:hypothetical protein